MLNSFSHLTHSSVTATDGVIGNVKAAFFDDNLWTIRYLVVDTGSWLSGHPVLISPYAVQQPLSSDSNIGVRLTCEQVKNSPDIDTHQPVSRQHEVEFSRYYAYPEYWDGGGMWGMGGYPVPALYVPPLSTVDAEARAALKAAQAADVHLRNSEKVNGYDLQAIDGSIGHVQDFIFDDESWAIRYLVVDTRNWWPGGRKVLLATHWIDHIEWATSKVHVKLTREQVRSSPEFNESLPIARDYEQRLHDSYNRQGYWI